MEYPVVLIEPEEGFSVFCPSLPGCHSWGRNQEEALANIQEAIALWLGGAEEDALKRDPKVTHAFVTVTLESKRIIHDPVLDGDSPPKVEIRIKPMPRKSLPSGEFDRGYIPLSAAERRLRRNLIQQWIRTNDVFVAAELRKQQQREIPYREALHAIFGKAAQGDEWRLALCVEAKRDNEAKQELASWLADAVTERNSEELTRFAKCVKRVDRDETTKEKNAKLSALLFVLAFEAMHGDRPTQGLTREALIKKGIITFEERSNEGRDIFNGPILGELPKRSAGRRKKLPSSKIKG